MWETCETDEHIARQILAGASSDISSQWSETDVYPELSAPLLAWKTANPLNEWCWPCILNWVCGYLPKSGWLARECMRLFTLLNNIIISFISINIEISFVVVHYFSALNITFSLMFYISSLLPWLSSDTRWRRWLQDSAAFPSHFPSLPPLPPPSSSSARQSNPLAMPVTPHTDISLFSPTRAQSHLS